MPEDASPHPIATTLTWPAGMAWTSWHYMWRILPVYREEVAGSLPADLPPPIPDEVPLDQVQSPESGTGPLLHRTYECRIDAARITPEELVGELRKDPGKAAPWQIARFHKTAGEEGRMSVGDEFVVRMPGPWNGPVRVIETKPSGFRFATLHGHLEAGQIEWRAWRDDHLHFAVESWARGGDRFSAFLHDRLRMAKEVQLYMWTSAMERIAKLAEGRLHDGVSVYTRRVPAESFEPGHPDPAFSRRRG